jgi:hypothetical protein
VACGRAFAIAAVLHKYIPNVISQSLYKMNSAKYKYPSDAQKRYARSKRSTPSQQGRKEGKELTALN